MERLSHALRLPFAVAIGATAVLGSQAQAAPESIHELPQLHIDNPYKPHIPEASVVVDTSQASGYHYTANSLPTVFATAFDNALHNPVVQLGLRENAMTGADVFTASSSNSDHKTDNGEWNIYNNHLELIVFTDDLAPEKRLYSDARLVAAALEHEALHALNEKWYRYIRKEKMPLPSNYDSLILTASSEFNKSLATALGSLSPLCQGDNESRYNDNFHCAYTMIFSRFMERSYRCIDEGYAFQQPLGRIEPLPMGHPYDDLTETASSLLLSIDSNPSYVKDCLSTTTDMNILLRKLSGTILRLVFTATPPLETYFRKDHEKAATIDWLLEAA